MNTIIALAILRSLFKAKDQEWILIEKKAIKFLKTQKVENIDDLISQITVSG